LYVIEKAWQETGLSGFLVCKFALKRLPGQAPLVNVTGLEEEGEEEEEEE
jgi:E3 ubiquitin-protein ligase UHRF1